MRQVRVILIGGSLDYRSFTVVGIMPASFRYPVDAPPEDVWIPVAQDPLFGPLMSQPGARLLRVIGRLKPGVSLTQAQAAMGALGARLAQEFAPQDSGFTIRVLPYQQVVVGNAKPRCLFYGVQWAWAKSARELKFLCGWFEGLDDASQTQSRPARAGGADASVWATLPDERAYLLKPSDGCKKAGNTFQKTGGSR